jgi:hypothetical protein
VRVAGGDCLILRVGPECRLDYRLPALVDYGLCPLRSHLTCGVPNQ